MNTIRGDAAAGYAAFALTLWMNSMVPAGWFDPSDALLAQLLAIVLGGCLLALTGVLRALRGHALDAMLFLCFAAYWWVVALAAHLAGINSLTGSPGFLGWFNFVWALLAFGIWLAAWGDGVARMLFALGVCVSLLAYALAAWIHLDALTVLGGYLGLVTAVVGIYIAAAEVVNAGHGHTVLPLGEPSPGSRAG